MRPLLAPGSLALLLSACPSDSNLPGDDDSSPEATPVPDDDDTTEDVTPTVPEAVTLSTEDGLTISGTFQAPPGAALGPAVLLLHQFARDRHDFDEQWLLFQAAAISTLVIDFRGHGASDPAPVDLPELLTDPDQLRFDVEAALAWLRAREGVVDPERIGIEGLSVGGNLAIAASHRTQQGDAAYGVPIFAAISARLENAQALAESTELQLAGGQYVASVDDHPPAEDAQALFDLTAEPRDVRVVQAQAAHGVELIEGSADVRQGTVDWFEEEL